MHRSLEPGAIAPPFARYSHGVLVPAGQEIVLVSGQLGQDADGNVPADAEAQADICFGNIGAILAEGGMGPAEVAQLRAFVTDRVHMVGYMRARDRWLAQVERPPASTLVIVSGFTRPEFVVEIEVIAARPI